MTLKFDICVYKGNVTEFKANQTRVNFRSAGKVDVAKIAHQFNGGGHKNASGCSVDKNFKSTKPPIYLFPRLSIV